ncbi:MAG: hypothetical protein M0P97_02335 [Candidatus Moranbacteria bacterium]|jgi:hypothetical protein|nr:hypothetical protein [Candidatus Moranbacteria bacterium]
MRKKNHFSSAEDSRKISEEIFGMAYIAIPLALLFFSAAWTFLAVGKVLGLH